MSGRTALSASWKSEARREGSGDQRPGLPGSWSPSEVRAIRNNESPILGEEGSPAAT